MATSSAADARLDDNAQVVYDDEATSSAAVGNDVQTRSAACGGAATGPARATHRNMFAVLGDGGELVVVAVADGGREVPHVADAGGAVLIVGVGGGDPVLLVADGGADVVRLALGVRDVVLVGVEGGRVAGLLVGGSAVLLAGGDPDDAEASAGLRCVQGIRRRGRRRAAFSARPVLRLVPGAHGGSRHEGYATFKPLLEVAPT